MIDNVIINRSRSYYLYNLEKLLIAIINLDLKDHKLYGYLDIVFTIRFRLRARNFIMHPIRTVEDGFIFFILLCRVPPPKKKEIKKEEGFAVIQ